MTLQTSGPISFSQIAAEFGDTAPHSISEFYGAASGIPSSGTLNVSDFYGKSAYNGPPSINIYVISGGGPGGRQVAVYGHGNGGGAGSVPVTETIYGVDAGVSFTVTVGAGGSTGNDGSQSTISWAANSPAYIGNNNDYVNGRNGGRGGDQFGGPTRGGGGGIAYQGGTIPYYGQSGSNYSSFYPNQNPGGNAVWRAANSNSLGQGAGGGGGGYNTPGTTVDEAGNAIIHTTQQCSGGKGSDGVGIAGYSGVFCAGGGGGTAIGLTIAAGGSNNASGGTGGNATSHYGPNLGLPIGFYYGFDAVAGAANTGTGGGGGAYQGPGFAGNNAPGGSGFVIVQFSNSYSNSSVSTTGSPSYSTPSNLHSYIFYSSGTISF